MQIGASCIGIVFFVSLSELFFTIRRRKAHAALETRIKGNQNYLQRNQVNKLVLEDEGKILETEKHLQELSGQVEGSKTQVVTEYEEKIKKLQEESEKEIASAKARAKKA